MKSVHLCLIVFCTLTIRLVWAVDSTSDKDRQKAVKQSQRILSDLYQVLRNIAFPTSSYSFSDTTHNRFILVSPGKVLNYFDYYPGDEYTASLKAKNTSAPHILVPPSVMEKWFDISDVVVGGDLNSGETGKSMSQIYENILSQITVRDIKALYQDAEVRYNEAMKYLTVPIQNPLNLNEHTTRMNLYSIYKRQYAEHRLNMEEKINNARLTKSSLEYELWFQRNFKFLNAKVENAYSKWLVFGEKELVELYKTFLDTTSAGSALKEARISLRASGVSSLDRTRTIYPVSFEPSNWYEYLLARDSPPSRDMLFVKRSRLQSELATLNATQRYTSESQVKAQPTTDALEKRVKYISDKRDNATRDAIDARIECMNRSSTTQPRPDKDPCKQLEEATDAAVDATFQEAQASSEYNRANFLLKSNEKFRGFMQSRKAALEQQIAEIDSQLNNLEDSQVFLGEIAESPEFKSHNESRGDGFDAKWLKFDYNSDSSHSSMEKETRSSSSNIGLNAMIPIPKVGTLDVGLGFRHNEGTAKMKEAFNSANLKASGEILRVFIKRPWFKPSLFDSPMLNFVQQDSETQKTAYVSPPPSTEAELADIINGKHKNVYLMPEYVTSFLLARNVKLQFSGIDSSSVSKAMQLIAGGHLTAGLTLDIGLPVFSLEPSVGVKKGKQSVIADRTANGMVINIPGAQLIGYYTQVLPQFPKQQS